MGLHAMKTLKSKKHFLELGVCMRVCYQNNSNVHIYIQGVLLPDRQTLRGDSKHEDKYY